MKKKKGFTIFVFLLIVLSQLSMVVAAEGDTCTTNSGCDSGEVCDADLCVTYCGIGEAQCSDGLDNDGDGFYDYFGTCDDPTSSVDCSDLKTAGECSDACELTYGAVYTEEDGDCRSPLDTDEGTGVETTYAPEEGQGFWAKLLDFLFFWN